MANRKENVHIVGIYMRLIPNHFVAATEIVVLLVIEEAVLQKMY